MKSHVSSVLYAGFGIVLLVLLVLLATLAFPGVVGGDDTFIVTSDSMSPTVEAGDVIVTRDVTPEELEPGDVVTFHDGGEANTGYVTHRIVDVVEIEGELYFELQGDANDEPDEGLVPAEYVHGEYHFAIPFLGHLLLFARSSLGLFVFVIAPGIALMATGVWQLLRAFGVVSSAAPTPALEAADEPPALEAPAAGGLDDDSGDPDVDPGGEPTDQRPSETDTTNLEGTQ